jgi:glutaconate CoA-transferase, subunit B
MTAAAGEDLMIVAGSRLLQDHRVVFAGVGAPLVASALAQQLHAPHLTIILEGGFVGPRLKPGKLPISTNEMRAAYGSAMHTGIIDVFLYSQRGYFDYGFIGAAQVDRFGNVNTSVLGTMERPKLRISGTGGANDIVSSCHEVFILTKHEPRRFVERVDFITSPGYLEGGESRERAGLVLGRPTKVITDLAVMGFHPETREMTLESLQPGATVDSVAENTGFELLIPSTVPTISPPTTDELGMLRVLQTGVRPEAPPQQGAGADAEDRDAAGPQQIEQAERVGSG